MRYINEVKVFLPEGGSLSVAGYKLVPGVMEENISATLEQWISLMASKGLVDGNSRVLHVFRNGEMLYLDMNASFYSSLQKLDKDRASLFMTALLRTVIENFDPIKEVKFLTEGKDATMTTPVDLTVSWRLAPKS
ncbi:GerMN domain-containing protein [Acetomicrobium flavidum]